jgi:hypothetical protein
MPACYRLFLVEVAMGEKSALPPHGSSRSVMTSCPLLARRSTAWSTHPSSRLG